MMSTAPCSLRQLPARPAGSCAFVVQGGPAVLDKIEAEAYDVFNHRPVLVRLAAPRLARRRPNYAPR